jgi:DNA ligase-associated metallophosphoesterase
MATQVTIAGVNLQLLPERAIYIESLNSLLVSDVHLGKSETFQAKGIPISNQVNQQTLERLQDVCFTCQPKKLFILGDLFHSRLALVDPVLLVWERFLQKIEAEVYLIVGNHDRPLISTLKSLSIHCIPDAIQLDNLVLSHEPFSQENCLNICGHIHPCVRIRTRLDQLRLPCFYWERSHNRLTLPSFGEFTGGYEVALDGKSMAYLIAEGEVIPFGV